MGREQGCQGGAHGPFLWFEPRFGMDKKPTPVSPSALRPRGPLLDPNQNLHVAQRKAVRVITNPGSTFVNGRF